MTMTESRCALRPNELNGQTQRAMRRFAKVAACTRSKTAYKWTQNDNGTRAHKLKHQKHLPSTVFVLKQQMASLPNPYFNEALQHVENTYFAQLRTVLTLSGSTGVFFVVVVNVINNMLNRACILTYSWKKRKLHNRRSFRVWPLLY